MLDPPGVGFLVALSVSWESRPRPNATRICILLRFQSIDADTVVSRINQNKLYICPHFDLNRILTRTMFEDPVDFRPIGPGPYKPKDRIIDNPARQIDRRKWRQHFIPSRGLGLRDIAMPLSKEQAICCGFKNGGCRTSESIQRLKDEGTTAWMKGLTRL